MSNSISIALCTYNGEKYIIQQLESIINQSILPKEIVICDDISTDRTIEVAKDFLKSQEIINWSLFKNDKNLGVTKNFEKAISLCTGDIIFTCDQDDVWLHNKIETCVDEFFNNPDLLMVFSDAYLVDDNLSKTGLNLWSAVYPQMNKLITHKDFINVLAKNNIMTGMTMAFRRKLVDISVPFDKDWIHDYWLAITGSLIGQVKAIDKPLVLYRQHSSNVLGAKKESLKKKIESYTSNFRYLYKIREQNLLRYRSITQFINKNSHIDEIKIEDKLFFENGLSYWKRMIDLQDSGVMYSIKSIFSDYTKGNYHKYYTGFRGLLRDFLYVIFFRHIF